jgi:hypothetical protein
MRIPQIGAKKTMYGIAVMVAMATASCSAGLSEVQTNSGGTLDCPSDSVRYAAIDPVPSAAAASPAEALAVLGDDLVPPGISEVESETAHGVVYLDRDTDGNRLGRVIVEEREGTGWLPVGTERCD